MLTGGNVGVTVIIVALFRLGLLNCKSLSGDCKSVYANFLLFKSVYFFHPTLRRFENIIGLIRALSARYFSDRFDSRVKLDLSIFAPRRDDL